MNFHTIEQPHKIKSRRKWGVGLRKAKALISKYQIYHTNIKGMFLA